MYKVSYVLLTGLFAPALMAAGTHEHGHDHGHAQSGVGKPATVKPDRIVAVSMLDSMRFVFDPGLEDLADGEVVEFVVRNDGAIRHEFSIGNAEEQARHAEMMRRMPDMEHDDPNAVTLDPGETGVLKWRFTGDDTVVFACNIPGHFEAGMVHRAEIVDDSSR